MHFKLLPFPLTAAVLVAGLAACHRDDAAAPVLTAVAADTYVLTSGNQLIGFAAADPSRQNSVALQVPAGETLLGGDIRPADGLLYVLTKAGTAGKLYTVDTSTGALAAATAASLSNATGGAAIELSGVKFGVDFNPVADRLRVVSDTGQNLRINVAAAASNTIVDAAISSGLGEAAYTNSFASTCQTDLYYLNGGQLFLSAVPNGLTTNAATPRAVGSLGVNADANSGFDVRTSATGNTLVAALRVGGAYGYYEINPATGAATNRGSLAVPADSSVVGLIATLPAAGATPALSPGNTLAVLDGTTPSLVSFNRAPSGSPAKVCSTVAITGIGAGETIVGGDSRPANGQLYLLTQKGSVGKLYTLASSGVATAVATLAADASDASAPYAGLDGGHFGVDFNPVPDRLRVVSDSGQNLRINVDTGATTTDTNLTTAGGGSNRTGISAAAYTNSLAGGSAASLTATLYALDSSADALVRIGNDPANGIAGDPGNPNSGVVMPVAALTSGGAAFDLAAINSFEIIGSTGGALVTSGNTLYSLGLVDGALSAVGNFTAPVLALSASGAQAATVYGVTISNKLVSFAPSAPGIVTAIGTIGVPAGETVLGIDFRPSVGPRSNELWALTSAGKLYTVNPTTAAATPISSLNAASLTFPGTSEHGVDFNPLPDRLRVVNTSQQNLRINPETGATTVDGNLSAANVFGAGYTNSFGSAAATKLYYLAEGGSTDTLQTTTAPNDGMLTPVGSGLGVDVSAIGDLDIAGGHNGFALAALQPAAGGISGLYRLSLSAGTATSIGNIATAGDEAIRGIAIQLK
jgi:Domain of unknown function (DUF4394)